MSSEMDLIDRVQAAAEKVKADSIEIEKKVERLLNAMDLYRDLYLSVKEYLFWYDNRPDNWQEMYITKMRDAVEVIEGKEPENAGR